MSEIQSQGEIAIQQAILERLGSRTGVRVFRMNVGKARDPRTGQVLSFGVPGMADILALVGGRYAWLEVKTQTGSQSQPQRAFQRMVDSLGGIYRIVRSVDEAEEAIACLLP